MPHPIFDAITRRRSASARQLIEPGPGPDEIARIVEAGAAAPDHGMLVPFRFLDIAPAARERLAAAFISLLKARSAEPAEADLAKARNKATLGPVNIGLVARVRADHPKIIVSDQWLAVGGALQNMVLAAEALGYGIAIRSGADFGSQQASAALQLEPGEELVAILTVGTVADKPPPRPKPELAAVFRRVD